MSPPRVTRTRSASRLAVQLQLVLSGAGVFTPVGPCGVDLVALIGREPLRVLVRVARLEGGNPNLRFDSPRKAAQDGLFDLLALYYSPEDSVFLIPAAWLVGAPGSVARDRSRRNPLTERDVSLSRVYNRILREGFTAVNRGRPSA